MSSNGIHNPTIYDVIIIGGGVSGLVAAHYLTKLGRTVLILEARDRLGGRVHTVQMNDVPDHKVDLGASYIHGTDGNPLVEVAKKLNMELHFTKSESGVLRDHTGAVPEHDLKIFENTSVCMFSELKQASQTSADALAPGADIPLIEPFLSADSPLFAGLTSDMSREQAIQLARSYAGWCGADLERVSFKWWGFEQDTQGPDAVVTSGYVALVNWLRDEIIDGGGTIKLGKEVVSIEYIKEQHQKATVSASSAKDVGSMVRWTNTSYTGRYALITLPLGVMQNRPPKFTPPMPKRRLDATHRLGSGLLNKVIVYYETAWWAPTQSVYLLPDPAKPVNLLGPADAPAALHVHDLWTLQNTPALCFFMTGPAAEKIETLSDEVIARWAAGVIEQYLSPGKPAPPPTQVITTRWLSDPYALGSYSFIPITKPGEVEATPLDMIEMSHALWGKFFFAGEHTAPDEYASVHAAWNSGLREARKLKLVLNASDGCQD